MSDRDEANLVLEFCHRRLGATRLDIPFAAITAEAREVALTWAAKQGVQLQESNQTGRPKIIFVCSFHPECDILYVPLDCCNDLFLEPSNRPFKLTIFWPGTTTQPAMKSVRFLSQKPYYTRIARFHFDLISLLTCSLS